MLFVSQFLLSELRPQLLLYTVVELCHIDYTVTCTQSKSAKNAAAKAAKGEPHKEH